MTASSSGGSGRREDEDPPVPPARVRPRAEDITFPIPPVKRLLGNASNADRAEARSKLLEIIRFHRFSVLFQPVVDVLDQTIMGHEALCRGPGGTAFEAADYLFGSSYELDLARDLDQACRDTVLQGCPRLEPGSKLFLNVLPDTLAAGLVSVREILDSVAEAGLVPSDVVLELSERIPLEHAGDLRRRVEPFRKAGFLIAMDDIGAGYWSLRRVPEVAPDFLKIDRCLVHALEKSEPQQDAVAAIVELGRRHGAEVICEGIEEQAELDEVIRQGARYGQGFLLAQPLGSPVSTVSYKRPATG
jgi:EAL domain-containing protein (putative c-di-GMP-specific phosphodiesterase class I)